jgi:RNA polymerase sigma-70 factor (ECF subfamily)
MQLQECPAEIATEEWRVDVVDLATLGKLFEEHRPRLLAMIERRSDQALAARRDPEDILSAAYVKAQARWEEFKRSGMTGYSWLYRIVLDSLLDDHDFQTRRRRNPHAEVGWPDHSSLQGILGLVSPLTSPSEALAKKELQERLRRQIGQTLDQLKAEDREILSMRFFDLLSTEEAAQVLDIPVGTCRQRYSRARLRFRDAWKRLYGREGI